MPQPSQSIAVPAVSAANRERALEQFYWLQPVLEEGVPLKRLARERGVPLRTAQRGGDRPSTMAKVTTATDWLEVHRPRTR